MQIPRKAESFSSLSLMFRRDVHLERERTEIGMKLNVRVSRMCDPCELSLRVQMLIKRHQCQTTMKERHRKNRDFSPSPRPDKLRQHASNLLRTHVAQATDGNCWKRRERSKDWLCLQHFYHMRPGNTRLYPALIFNCKL